MTLPTSRSRAKLLLCACFAIAGCIAAWCFALNRQAHSRQFDSVALIDRSSEVRGLLTQRAASAADEGRRDPLAAGRGPHLVRTPISAVDARMLFPIDEERYVYDPQTYYRYKGGLNEECACADYPGGHFTRRTSRDGFREDFERLPEKRDALVVVAGDSQTDGLCRNSESYANRAEAELRARHPGRVIEVLNAGVGAFTFYNYLGTLEKLLDLGPAVFVMAFYSGNDFKDMVVPGHYFNRTPAPAPRPEYVSQLKQALALGGSAAVIALNPILYFKHEAGEAQLAQESALGVCAEVVRVCAEHGIDLVVIHIPPAFRPGQRLPPIFAEAQCALGLTDDDMRTNDRMADELIEKLREWRVDVLDLRAHFPPDIESYYWSDMHLNLKGHAFVAELLAPELDALLARRAHAAGGLQLR